MHHEHHTDVPPVSTAGRQCGCMEVVSDGARGRGKAVAMASMVPWLRPHTIVLWPPLVLQKATAWVTNRAAAVASLSCASRKPSGAAEGLHL